MHSLTWSCRQQRSALSISPLASSRPQGLKAHHYKHISIGRRFLISFQISSIRAPYKSQRYSITIRDSFPRVFCISLPHIFGIPLSHVFNLVSHPHKDQDISLERINPDGDKVSRFGPRVLVVELG